MLFVLVDSSKAWVKGWEAGWSELCAQDGPLEKLRLQFDGDEVEAGDTPDSLDMEDDNVVDCLW